MRTYFFDTETHLIQPHEPVPRLVCLQSACDDEEPELYVSHHVGETMAEALADPDTLFVGHYVAFDFAVLLRAFPELSDLVWQAYDEGRVWDTGLWERLYRNAEGTLRRYKYSLSDLHERATGKKLEGKKGDDIWRLRYGELESRIIDGKAYWPFEAVEYALEDVRATRRVYRHQKAEGVPPTFFDQVRAEWALLLMSSWGLRTDPQRVQLLEDKLQAQALERRAFLQQHGLVREDGTKDMKAVRARVEAAYKGAPPRTAKGGISTSRRVLNESGDPVLVEMAETGKVDTYLNTFLPTLRAGTERPICARFTTLKETGRTSCSKPNLQNLPADDGIRSCFVPREGWVYVGADYAVAELACFAEVLYRTQGRSRMKEALEAGYDLHLVTGASILGTTYEDLLARYNAGDPEAKSVRKLSKAANFGFLGGLGKRFAVYAKSFGIEISETEALNIKRKWLDAYPELQDHFSVVSDNASNSRGWTFQHPVTGFLRGDVTYTQGANTYVQHLCAHGAKRALYHLVRATKIERGSPLFGCAVVNFVHDEFIVEAPEGRHHEVAQEVARLMVEHMSYYLTNVPIKAEGYAMDAWYKSAEPIYDAAGRLEVWSGGASSVANQSGSVAA